MYTMPYAIHHMSYAICHMPDDIPCTMHRRTYTVYHTTSHNWSGTPPVETTTSRNKNARRISPNVRGNAHKLRRILQISTKFRKKRLISYVFLWKFVEFCIHCGDFREKSAKFCGHFCFDWSLFRLVASRLDHNGITCLNDRNCPDGFMLGISHKLSEPVRRKIIRSNSELQLRHGIATPARLQNGSKLYSL